MARCYNRVYNRYYYCRGAWSGWGRWLLLGLILAAVLVVLLAFACITSRRRRKLGRQPYYGTGWAAPAGKFGGNTSNGAPQMEQGYTNNYSNNATYGNNQTYGNNAPAPAYGQNAEYYGGQTAQTGTYQPPAYPPPAQTRN